MTSVRLLTAVADALLEFEPFPRCDWTFNPQHIGEPELRRAQAWPYPAERSCTDIDAAELLATLLALEATLEDTDEDGDEEAAALLAEEATELLALLTEVKVAEPMETSVALLPPPHAVRLRAIAAQVAASA